MNTPLITTARLSLLGAALLVLGGCANPTKLTDWSRVSLRERHAFMPTLTWDERPTAVVTAGPGGMVVGAGPGVPARAAQMVAQDGQIRLVSQETFAAMQSNQPTGTMGASPAGTQSAPASPAAPAAGQPAPAR
jgi:hypothetical protein